MQEPGGKEYKGTVADYISGALGSVFGQNFTNSDKAHTADFDNTTFRSGVCCLLGGCGRQARCPRVVLLCRGAILLTAAWPRAKAGAIVRLVLAL